jgi:hypothetical protein
MNPVKLSELSIAKARAAARRDKIQFVPMERLDAKPPPRKRKYQTLFCARITK